MALDVEQYLDRVGPPGALYRRLRAADLAGLEANVKHFTEHEGDDRDAIVRGYLGDAGVRKVVDAVVEGLLPTGAMNPAPAIVDLGAGSGFFTRRVEEALRARGLRPRMFTMDATPAMLKAQAKGGVRAVPFLGLLEDVEGSVREARALQPLPELFDGAFSTLALHHCPDPPAFFAGAARVLGFGAPLVVVDLVEHGHVDFRERLGDAHLGFDPAQARAWALDRFGEAEARVLDGVCCSSAARKVALFALAARR